MRHSSERTTRQTAVMPHLHLLWVCCDTPDAMTCHQTLVAPHEPHLNGPVSRGQSTGRDAENCSGSHQNFWSPQVSFGGGSPKTPPPQAARLSWPCPQHLGKCFGPWVPNLPGPMDDHAGNLVSCRQPHIPLLTFLLLSLPNL